jgi:hypothetical protein
MVMDLPASIRTLFRRRLVKLLPLAYSCWRWVPGPFGPAQVWVC